jgi:hypothetical protein
VTCDAAGLVLKPDFRSASQIIIPFLLLGSRNRAFTLLAPCPDGDCS